MKALSFSTVIQHSKTDVDLSAQPRVEMESARSLCPVWNHALNAYQEIRIILQFELENPGENSIESIMFHPRPVRRG